MVEWVYRGVSSIECIDEVCVATDDDRIKEAVERFGGNCVMTRSDHHSGTERCYEVVNKLKAAGKKYDVMVNVQGDEPFVNKEQIETLLAAFNDENTKIATLAKKITTEEELMSPNNVKVVTDIWGDARYFSRTPIPYLRDCERSQWLEKHDYLKHIGIYAYRTDILDDIMSLEESPLEACEKLEQLRWVEQGYPITVVETDCENIGIDTPEDLAIARQRLEQETR